MEEDNTYDKIDYDNDVLGNVMPPSNPFEDERFKLQREMLIDDTGAFLEERLRQLPNITPRARTKLYQIITTFFSQKNVVTNFPSQKEFDIANLNLEIAIELLWLGLDAWDLANNNIGLMVDLIRSSYFPTILRGRGGFERTHQNLSVIRSEVGGLDREAQAKKKRKKFGWR